MPTDPRLDYALREPRLPKPVDESMAFAEIDNTIRLRMYRTLQELPQREACSDH
jgi:hypothetical protein